MNYLYIALISMVPLIELRGAIPVSQGLGLPIIPSYIVCILANMVPVPFIYLFARKVLVWGCDKPVIGKFFTWCLDKGERGGKKLQERHLQVVDLCPVKFQRVLLQRLVAPGADLGNDAVHHILHVFLRADVPVQDLLGPELIKIIQLDHFVSSCKVLRSASSMASISLCLNW